MAEIVYDGPKDESDPTTVLEIPSDQAGKPNVRLPKGQAVKVSDKQNKAARAIDGHKVRAAKEDDPRADKSETTAGGDTGTGA